MKKAFIGPKQRSAFLGQSRQLIIVVAALLLTSMGFAQTRAQLQRIDANGYTYKSGAYRVLFYLPEDTVSTADSGSLAYLNGRLWLKKELKWVDWGAKQITDSSFTFGGDTIIIRGTGGSAPLSNLGNGIQLLVPGSGIKTLETGSTAWFGIDNTTYTDKIRLLVDPQVGYGLKLAPITDVMSIDTITGNHPVTTTQLRDTSIAIRAAIGSGGSGTPPGADQQVIYNKAGVFGADAGMTYNEIQNKVTTDSLSIIKARATRYAFDGVDAITQFNADTLFGSGHSILHGANAYPIFGFIYLIKDFLGYVLDNQGVPSTGNIVAVSKQLLGVNPGHNKLTAIMPSLNEWRTSDVDGAVTGPKTRASHYNTLKSVFWNAQQKNNINPTNGSGVTRSGSWTLNWDASVAGGKNTGLGAYNNQAGAYIEYTATDSVFGVRVIGGDGSGSIYITAEIEVRIDGIPVDTIYTNNQTNGNNLMPGSLDYRLIPITEVYAGLSLGSHTIRLTNLNGAYFLMDGFFNVLDASQAKYQLWFHEPHMQMQGYSGTQLTYTKTDQMNARTDSLKATIYTPYRNRIIIVNTNDPTYGYDTVNTNDGIHPDTVGHAQIADIAILSFSTSFDEPTLFFDTTAQKYVGIRNRKPYYLAYESDVLNSINAVVNNSGFGLIGKTTTTSNALTKWTNTSPAAIGNSNVTDNGTTVASSTPFSATGIITTMGSGSGFVGNRRDNNTTAFTLYSSAGDLQFFLGSTDKARLTSGGDFGIGTSSPSRRLHSEVSDATTNTVVYPFMLSHLTSGTNAIGSGVGLELRNENAIGTNVVTGSVTNVLTDATTATEDADFNFNLIRAGTMAEVVNIKSAGALQVQTDGDPNGAVFDLYRNDVTPTAGDRLGEIHFYGRNTSSTKTQYAALYAESPGITAGSESGRLLGNITVGGGIVESFRTEASGSNTVTTLSASARLDGGTKSVSLGDISVTPNFFKYQNNTNGQMDVSFYNSHTGTGAYTDLQVAAGSTSGTANALRLMKFSNAWSSVGAYQQSGAAVEAGSNLSGGLSFLAQHASGEFRFYTGGFFGSNERLRITSGGSLGIGITAPTEMVDVAGKIRTRGVANGSIDDSLATYNDGVLERIAPISTHIKDSTGYYTITGTTTDATPTMLSIISLPNTSMTTIEATCVAIKNDGTSGYSAVKFARYMKDNVPALLSGSSNIVGDGYSGTGLSTATFTMTNSGTSAAIQVTGEAATTIQWKIRYKILQMNVNL